MKSAKFYPSTDALVRIDNLPGIPNSRSQLPSNQRSRVALTNPTPNTASIQNSEKDYSRTLQQTSVCLCRWSARNQSINRSTVRRLIRLFFMFQVEKISSPAFVPFKSSYFITNASRTVTDHKENDLLMRINAVMYNHSKRSASIDCLIDSTLKQSINQAIVNLSVGSDRFDFRTLPIIIHLLFFP